MDRNLTVAVTAPHRGHHLRSGHEGKPSANTV